MMSIFAADSGSVRLVSGEIWLQILNVYPLWKFGL